MKVARRALLGATLAAPALAQAPRTIRLIVPFAPGGGSDTLARLLAPALGVALGGTSVVVENRAGAGSQIGAEAVMRSPPDGSTLLLGDTPLVTIPALQAAAGRLVPFQAAVDFTPIAALVAAPTLIMVAGNAPWRDTRELLATARARPGSINFASGGVATSTHLMIELLQLRSGVQVTHVPYRGTGAAIQDLISGQVQAMIQAMATAAPLVAAGQMRVVGVAADRRLPEMPEVPTLREQGIDLVSAFWWGVLGPPGMAVPLVETLSTALRTAMASDAVASRLPALGLERLDLGPAPFRDMLAAETARWRDVVQTAGIKPE